MRSAQGSIPGDGVSRVQFQAGGHVSRAIHYFIPILVALGRGIYISLMIRFLYYNCLGFDLVLWLQHISSPMVRIYDSHS